MKAIRKEILEKVICKDEYGFKPKFPTFCVCMICGGYYGTVIEYNQGKSNLVCTDEEGVQLALINYGYWLHKWEGSNVANAGPNFVPRPCTCECRHEFKETSRPANHRSGEHTCKCSKCGLETAYDTSD